MDLGNGEQNVHDHSLPNFYRPELVLMLTDAVVASALVGSALAIWVTFTIGVARVQRESFEFDLMRLRDEIEMDVFAGDLPDVRAVQYLWAKADFLAKYPEMASLSRMVAVLRHAPLLRGTPNPMIGIKKDLGADQLERFESYEARMVHRMAEQLIKGSRFWFLMPFLALVAVLISRGTTVAEPDATAGKFNDLLNSNSEPGPDGNPVVSHALTPVHRAPLGHREPIPA